MMGVNPAINTGGPVPSNVMPMGSFANGMANIRGQSNASGAQTFPHGGMNQTQPGQMGTIPGLNSYQVDYFFPLIHFQMVWKILLLRLHFCRPAAAGHGNERKYGASRFSTPSASATNAPPYISMTPVNADILKEKSRKFLPVGFWNRGLL